MSRIRSNQITNQSADGAPVVQNGLVVTGVLTSTSFSGDGSGLVGVASTDSIITGTAATFNNKVAITNGTLEIPAGNTAGRNNPAFPGNLRYNTDLDKIEYYNGTVWKNVSSSQPLINNISPTSIPGTAGTSITIVGNNFESGCNVHFISSVNGSSTAAGSVAFVNSGILTATAPALTVSGEPYGVRVTNPDGGQGLMEAALDAGSAPSWQTASGSLRTGVVRNVTLPAIAVTATDADPGQNVVYSEVTNVLTAAEGSGGMGLTLIGTGATAGVITGTAPNVGSDTTFNFTLRASDGTNNTDRAFSIGVIAASNPVYIFRGSSQGGTGASDTSVVTGWSTNGNNSHSNGSGNANNDRLYAYKNGGGGTNTGIHQNLYSNNAVQINSDHDKFQTIVSSYSNNGWSNSYGFSPAAPSNTWFSSAFSKSRGTGTYTDDIPASMKGNSYYFYMKIYGGQYLSAQMQMTLVKSYNSANP